MAATHIYLCRHGLAEGLNPKGDRARALTAQGRERLTRLVTALDGNLQVRRIVTSPYLRAQQTAELIGAALGIPVEEHDDLASSASGGAELLMLALQLGPGTLLVGHNPEIASALAQVAGQGVPTPPGTLAALRLAGDQLELDWARDE